MTTDSLTWARLTTATLLLLSGVSVGCSLGTSSRGSFLEALDEPVPSSAEAVHSTLEDYRSAYESRDIERLRGVWELTSLDAFFLERAWADCESLTVAVEAIDIDFEDDEVSASFDQRNDYRCEEREAPSHRRLRAGFAEQADGSWKITTLTTREPTRGPRRAASKVRVPATSAAPTLEALSAYQSAFQACDVDALSRTWVMSRRERDLFERFCERHDAVSISIEQQDVKLEGDRGQVQFAQTVTSERGGRTCQASATLRAMLVKREGGDWSMWDLREVQ